MQVVIGRFAVQLGESKQRNRSEQTEEFGSVAAFLPRCFYYPLSRKCAPRIAGFDRVRSFALSKLAADKHKREFVVARFEKTAKLSRVCY